MANDFFNGTAIYTDTENEDCLSDMFITIFSGEESYSIVNLNGLNQKTVSFGRGEDNDITIKSSLVSSRHGTFEINNNTCRIIDNDSTNGIYINNVHQKNAILKDGDVIRIDNPSSPLKNGVAIIFSRGNLNKCREYDLKDSEKVTIGRDSSCNICLSHLSVSRIHAVITRENGNYYITDNNSTNGVVVNGKILSRRQLLKEKDVIYITSTKLLYSFNKLIYSTYISGVRLDCQNITKIVRVKGKDRIISDNISLSIEPNEFVAIVGGSGAGKSTFMNCISGYSSPTSGAVSINGNNLFSNYTALKHIIGYVPQEDIVYDNLTLKSMLDYTARLRMPSDTSKEERNSRVEQVIKMTELTGREDTFIRRLSGGQRKRASIAVELLSDPNLFFLDEPTSGLDPGTERNLMNTLKIMAQSGKTIILVTHNTMNLHICDKIIFLGSGGKLCYFGPPEKACDYFGVSNFVDIYNLLNEDTEKWSEKYTALCENRAKCKNSGKQSVKEKKKTTSFLAQLNVLVKRYFSLIINDRQRLLLLLLQAPLLSILISLVADGKQFEKYETTQSLLFALACSALWIGIMNSIQEICKEKTILKREYMAGLKLSSYIFSKIIVLGFFSAIQSLLLTGTFAVLMGIPKKGIVTNPFLEMLITVFLTSLSSTAMGISVSAVSKNPDRAMTAAPLLLMPQLLFSGLLFNLEGVMKKISTVMINRWSMEAFGATADLNSLPSKLQEKIPGYVKPFEECYERSSNHLYNTWKMLMLLSVVFIIICYVLLASSYRKKQQ